MTSYSSFILAIRQAPGTRGEERRQGCLLSRDLGEVDRCDVCMSWMMLNTNTCSTLGQLLNIYPSAKSHFTLPPSLYSIYHRQNNSSAARTNSSCLSRQSRSSKRLRVKLQILFYNPESSQCLWTTTRALIQCHLMRVS